MILKIIQKAFSIIALLFIFACVTTKPNPIYQGPLPEKFSFVQQRNPLLATEIRKLPEIQDGISPSETAALDSLVSLYKGDPKTFDIAFNKMYQVGLPEVRKYCTPLQALFWMAEDGKLTEDNNPLAEYSLETLLLVAWEGISIKAIDKIINTIKNKNEASLVVWNYQHRGRFHIRFLKNETWDMISSLYRITQTFFRMILIKFTKINLNLKEYGRISIS